MPPKTKYPEDMDSDNPPDMNPWECREKEGSKPYKAFQLYLNMGASRSRVRVAMQLGCSVEMIRRWSSRWDWVNRARAYDNALVEDELEARRKKRAEKAATWEDRRLESADINWDQAGSLQKKFEEMIGIPLDKVQWDYATAMAFARLSAELRAAAINEGLAASDPFDPTTASPEELRDYVKQSGLKTS